MKELKDLYIVIAEDDVDDTYIIRKSFEKHPAFSKVQIVRNGKELWELLKIENENTPHLILTDVNMPILNGMEVLQKMSLDKALSAIPVFMYSSSSNILYEEKCRKLGVKNFFLKPYTLSEFDDIPDRMLRHLENEASN